MVLQDQDLVRLLKKSDRNAYSILFDKYFGPLYNFALHMVFREDVANDMVQEVFIALYEKPGILHDRICLKPYLFHCVRNRCFNYLRDRKVEDRRLNLYAEACIWSENIDLIEEEDVLSRVYRAMEKLPDKCREICRLRYREGLKFEDIARILNMSESTVRVQVARGMEKLRQDFSAQEEGIILFFHFFLKNCIRGNKMCEIEQ